MSYADYEINALKQRVEKLERLVALMMGELDLQCGEELNQDISPEMIALVRRGKKIEAIKRYRQETGVGLKEAKEFIDSLEP
jgi:ribosomal protein L7/L12